MNLARQRQWERKRKARLMSKIQKAHALAFLDEIFKRPSWAKRRGLTARLRVSKT